MGPEGATKLGWGYSSTFCAFTNPIDKTRQKSGII